MITTPAVQHLKRYAVALEVEWRRRQTRVRARRGSTPPKDWRDWLTTLFPAHFYHPLGKRHTDFWSWVLAIKADDAPRPFIGIWPRGSGKSTSAEVATVALGVRGRRKYALYIRETQEQADKSVENIAALLESSTIRRFYPDHAERKVGKFGNSRGWRRSRLRTAGGFTIDALGLDVAARGLKVEEQRPDMLIFDDIDGKLDSPGTTAKKRDTITHTILPAGASNVAVLGIQNLIIPGGIFTQLADNTADYLVDRWVSGPYPAIEGLQYEWQRDETTGVRRAVITAGRATWEGQNLEACQKQIDRFGIAAFVKECQHKVKEKAEGVALRFDASRHYHDQTDAQILASVKDGALRCFGGIDFGAWRFAFVLFGIDRVGRVLQLDEYFSQRESLESRAEAIRDLCQLYGLTGMVPIWGDAANPQDIMEINLAFRRIGSKIRVVAVAAENKMRKVAVERINNALDHNALLYRRGISYDWQLNRNAGSEGTPMMGSRLIWETENWSYPAPRPGEAQDQNPDDATADGADLIAAKRYALMSHWRAANAPVDYGTYEHDRVEPIDYKRGRFKEVPHAVDVFTQPSGRRSPRVSAPRPKVGR